MIDFHYWPTPNGWKVAIMLEETGLEYRMLPVNIGRGEQHAAAFLAISPNGRMPAIVTRTAARSLSLSPRPSCCTWPTAPAGSRRPRRGSGWR